ncbi:hypothetical protein J9356_001546 [Salmonella enterica]|nr:hypothetical protein [Salmonella enterica]
MSTPLWLMVGKNGSKASHAITTPKAGSASKSYAVSAKKALSAKESSVFKKVAGLGSPRYGQKAVALLNERIAKLGSIRAYHEHLSGKTKNEQSTAGGNGRV